MALELKPKNVTKADLLEMVEEKEAEIQDLKKQVADMERSSKYDEIGAELKAMKDSMMNNGFTDEQAQEMLMVMISQALNIAKPHISSKLNRIRF